MWAVCFGASVITAHDADAYYGWQTTAPSFYMQEFWIDPQQRELLIEVDSERGVDEVIHLLVQDPSTEEWLPMLTNDDYSSTITQRCQDGLATSELFFATSRIRFVNRFTERRKLLLIVHAKSPFTQGNARLCVDGEREPERIPVGGFVFPDTFLTTGAVDDPKVLLAVPAPDGSTWPVMMTFTDAERFTIGRVAWDGGAGGGTALRLPNVRIPLYFVGTPKLKKVDGSIIESRAGKTKIYVNDLTDTDGDGVGDKLEQGLGMCWNDSITPYTETVGTVSNHSSCIYTATSEDTDRDGLPDGEELFGYLGNEDDIGDDIAFPRWGASPRHKDVFVIFAKVYNATTTPLVSESLDRIRSIYNEAPNVHVHNPDGKDGISVHFDFNQLVYTTIFDENQHFVRRDYPLEHVAGVFSERVVRDIIPAFYIAIDGPVESEFYIQINSTLSPAINGTGQTPKALALKIVELMEQWVEDELYTCVVGGQTGQTVICDQEPTWTEGDLYTCPVDGQTVICDEEPIQIPFEPVKVKHIECNGTLYNKNDFISQCSDNAKIKIRIDTLLLGRNFTRDLLISSETEKNIKELKYLEYYPDYLFDENYVPTYIAKRFRYGVITDPGNDRGGGNAAFSRFHAQPDEKAIAHELGHTLGLAHHGHDYWTRYDVYLQGGSDAIAQITNPTMGNNYNCNPLYHSIMSYNWSDLSVGFSNLATMRFINASQVREDDFFIEGVDVNGYYLSIFRPINFLDPFIIDWNRNREADRLWSYNVSLRFGTGSCGPFTNGAQKLTDGDFEGSNDLIRVDHPTDPSKPGFIYVFYQTAGDKLSYQTEGGPLNYYFARLGEPENASCTGPDNPLMYPSFEHNSEGCLTWEKPQPLELHNGNSTNVSAYWWDGKVFVANTFPNGTILVSAYTVLPSGALRFFASFPISEISQGKPELAVMYFHSNGVPQEHLVLVYAKRHAPYAGTYQAHYWTGNNFAPWEHFSDAQSTDETFHNLSGGGSPSLVSWPDPYNKVAKNNELKNESRPRITCGIFPTTQNALRAYCFDPYTLRWEEFSETVFPKSSKGKNPAWDPELKDPATAQCQEGEVYEVTRPSVNEGTCLPISSSPPELAMRYIRFADGSPTSLANVESHLQLTFQSLNDSENNVPFIWISEPLQMNLRHPLDEQWHFNDWRGHFVDQWTFTEGGTNIPLYDDSQIGGTFAIGVLQAEGGERPEALRFYPHADGSDNTDLWVGNDFKIMEDHICNMFKSSFMDR